jgi:putative restriction endonuclease
MVFGVFIHREDSIYDDRPEEQYQFPEMYLSRVRACEGDWIVYLEPSKVALTRGYYAIARVAAVVPDATASGMWIARIERGTYMDLARPVAFRGHDGLPVERGVLNEAGRISGRAQAAVRPLSPADFNRILDLGFPLEQGTLSLPRDAAADPVEPAHVRDMPDVYDPGAPQRLRQLVLRPERDRLFRAAVVNAYDARCAVSGFGFKNGGGRAEVEAAHIMAVGAGGPDKLSNGIAFSGTAHWMFDRGMIALDDDLSIRISRHVNDIDGVRAFLNNDLKAHAPAHPAARPNPRFLAWHRDNVFKR